MDERLIAPALIVGGALLLAITGVGHAMADQLTQVAVALLVILLIGAVLLGLILFGIAVPGRTRRFRDWRRRWRVRRDGWPATIARHALRQVGPDLADPGNPGHVIRLFHVPPGIYATSSIGVLIATNGTPAADGHHATVAVLVRPGHIDALAAAAEAAGMTRDQYAAIAIRT